MAPATTFDQVSSAVQQELLEEVKHMLKYIADQLQLRDGQVYTTERASV